MKRIGILLALSGLIICLSSCKQKQQSETEKEEEEVYVQRLTPDEFEKLISDTTNVVLLDVRTPQEYNESHMKHAIQIDFREDSFVDDCLKKLSRDKQIAVYCRSGFCSNSAAKILVENGFNVFDLMGGYTEWQKAGKETVSE